MVTGNELGTGKADEGSPVPVESVHERGAGLGAGVLVRGVVKLRDAIRSRVPIGYQDDEGFHYGTSLAGWIF